MPKIITESEIEEAVLDILKDLGYEIVYGPDIGPDGTKERASYEDVILKDRLRKALENINSNIPKTAIEEAIKKLLKLESPNLILNNETFHEYIINGIPVQYRKDGRIKDDY